AFHVFPSLCNGAKPLTLITAVLHPLAPLQVVQIPLNGFLDTGFEGFLWCPAQLTLNFAGVDSIAQVMARSILNVSYQGAIGATVRTRTKLIQKITENAH